MTDTVLIQYAKAHEIFVGKTLEEMAQRRHPDLVAQMREVADGTVQVGYDWNGSTFTAPAAPVQPPATGDILLAPATIASFASVAGAAFSYQNLTVPGIQGYDIIVRAWFSADFAPATVTYEAERAIGNNSLRMRFQKISTGAVTPTANQVLNVLVRR
jgi:hypothetical protein